jgi:hypothetical protein
MNDIKYIYFELYSENNSKPIIKNENVLLIKPDTNSNGYWGYRNMTERKRGIGENIHTEYVIVDQNWIDLTKYEFNGYGFTFKMFYGMTLDDCIKNCISKLIIKLRKEKLKEIIFEE